MFYFFQKYISIIQVHGILLLCSVLILLITFSVFLVKKLDMGHCTKGTDLILLLISLSVNVGSFSVYALTTVQ